MNLSIQSLASVDQQTLALRGDGVSRLSDVGFHGFDWHLNFQNTDKPNLSGAGATLLSVKRPDHVVPVNFYLMDSVRSDAIQMAAFFVSNRLWLFGLAHNRIPLIEMRGAYAKLSQVGKKAVQQASRLAKSVLCLESGRSKPSVAFVSLFNQPCKAGQWGGKQPRHVANQGCDYDFSHSIRSRIPPSPDSATIAGGVIPRASGTSYDASSRRNLAGNAIVVARSLIQRAYHV